MNSGVLITQSVGTPTASKTRAQNRTKWIDMGGLAPPSYPPRRPWSSREPFAEPQTPSDAAQWTARLALESAHVTIAMSYDAPNLTAVPFRQWLRRLEPSKLCGRLVA